MRFTLLTILYLITATALTADPLVDSWLTERSGAYAKSYSRQCCLASRHTFDYVAPPRWRSQTNISKLYWCARNSIDRRIPVHSLIWVGYHIIGPWYNNAGQTSVTPSFPVNQAILYRFESVPEAAETESWDETSLGAIGYFVDSVAIFYLRDAFGYVTTSNTETSFSASDQLWSRDAYVNESLSFDSSNLHQAGGRYLSHANPLGLRHQLGDSVNYDSKTNTYSDSFDGSHSPIIGWMNDGYPLYGSYGYGESSYQISVIRRMAGLPATLSRFRSCS